MTCGDIVVFSRVLTSSWKCSSHSILGLIGSLKSTRSFIENGLNKSSHTMWHKCDTSSYGMLSVRLSHVTLHELSPWVYHVLWGMNNHQWFFAVHWYHRFVHVPFDGFESTTNQVPFSKWVAWIWMNLIWLVVWNMNFRTFHILGISSSQLTNSIIFQRGRAQPPTSDAFVGRLLACWWLNNPDLDHGKYGQVMGFTPWNSHLKIQDFWRYNMIFTWCLHIIFALTVSNHHSFCIFCFRLPSDFSLGKSAKAHRKVTKLIEDHPKMPPERQATMARPERPLDNPSINGGYIYGFSMFLYVSICL